jgi:hypothetical protein
MCWLIFAGIRGQHGDPVARLKVRGFTAEPSRNPTCAQVGTPDVLAVTDGHCACSLYIPTQRYVGEDTQLMRARYRRKGWTDGKIERAVKARCAAAEKRAAMRVNRNLFPSTIEALVESGAEVSLLAHFFEGSFDEPFSISTRRDLTLTEFIGNGGTFAEDELTVIVR